VILEELRDLRLEMRADRRQAEADRQQAAEERRRSDERFGQLMRGFHQAFRDIRTVGLSIVKTLNQHTRILERIDGKLGARPPGHADGRGA
jgi:hypothetical protein